MEDFAQLALSNNDTFEEALYKLERVTTLLDEGNLSLNDLLKVYEMSISLYRFCNNKIDNANQKIKVLAKDTFVDFEN
ncbi:MAG: exodeoxyribonuclease VII small subunit [Anaeromicrobium sp.]|jgi:exodeoxyribonuclease VII small subunit|uniref:exodeoxyribonuclease VII small subunit n=1 Tax=Anaeromicrobium sp. TaxID=1929132 RepID=UPI0025E7F90C|nr:exodeoxyribonuclease VII small subunit [Anaeromicrobium sp.]MCT4596178.1 exodeoxyribonuclease VII small subunit [Anaeromicrobium sp.]